MQRGRYHPGLVRLQPSDIRRHPARNGPPKPAPPFTRNLPASTLRFSSAHTRFLREMSILPDLARIIPAPALHRDKPHPVFFQNTGCRKVSGSFFLFRATLRPAVPPEKRPMPTSRRRRLQGLRTWRASPGPETPPPHRRQRPNPAKQTAPIAPYQYHGQKELPLPIQKSARKVPFQSDPNRLVSVSFYCSPYQKILNIIILFFIINFNYKL